MDLSHIKNITSGLINNFPIKSSKNYVDILPENKMIKGNKKSTYFTVGYAKEPIVPYDLDTTKYYIAGYNKNNPALGLFDNLYASALWLDDNSGSGGHLMISVDIIGLLNNDIKILMSMLNTFIINTKCVSVSIMSTNNHSGIDTIGIWGNSPHTGKNKKFMQVLFNSIMKAAVNAYRYKKNGDIYFGNESLNQLFCNEDTTHIISDKLNCFKFIPNDKSECIYIVNSSIRPNTFDSKNLISSDFLYYLNKKISNDNNAKVFYIVGTYDKDLSCVYKKFSSEEIGNKINSLIKNIKDYKKLEPSISYIKKEFFIPLDNSMLKIAKDFNILDADIYSYPYSKQKGIKTELSLFRIDSINILALPCLIYSNLVFKTKCDTVEDISTTPQSEDFFLLSEIINDKDLIIFGLTNDTIGYVIHPNEFYLDESSPYLESGIDLNGNVHFEELYSLGIETASTISDALKSIIEK